jgi:hypothetical protein
LDLVDDGRKDRSVDAPTTFRMEVSGKGDIG